MNRPRWTRSARTAKRRKKKRAAAYRDQTRRAPPVPPWDPRYGRCYKKAAYPGEQQAWSKARELMELRNIDLTVYKCHDQNHWHLTSQVSRSE